MAYFHTTVLDEQIKALPTVDTASGSVATFDTDLTENLVSCVCEVASGSSEINVIHKGKNLIDDSKYYQLNTNIVVIGQTVSNANRTIYLPQGTYTIKVNSNITATIYYDFGNGSTSLGNTSEARTFTLSDNSYCAFWLYKSGGFTPSDYTRVQLEFGNTATNYQAFNGNAYNIPFGETLSGDGSFDVLSGILTRSDDTTKQLSANYIQTKNGINNIWCDTGDTEVKYLLTVGKKIS